MKKQIESKVSTAIFQALIFAIFITILSSFLIQQIVASSVPVLVQIYVYYAIPSENFTLIYHCKSRDYDWGNISLLYTAAYDISFYRSDIITPYPAIQCQFWWLNKYAIFEVYNSSWVPLDTVYTYKVKIDGFYLDHIPDHFYNFNHSKKIYSW